MEIFRSFENHACRPALFEGGNHFTSAKSDLITCLEEIFDAWTETPVITCIVLDEAAIVQILSFAHQMFIPYISAKL